MKSLGFTFALFFATTLGACASPTDATKPDESVSAYVLSEVPSDIPNPTLVDFGGAVHLIGWDISPTGQAAPGSTLHLKFYWTSVKKLSPGWRLFTHVIVADAPKPYAFDGVGPLRQKLPASDFVPGNVYVDEQDIAVPDTHAPELTIAVGVGHEAVQVAGSEVDGLSGSRLEILSGLSDGHDRAVIARLATGATPGQKPDARGDRRRALPPGFKGRMPMRPAGTDLKEKP
jgi:hypothetical protein